MATLADMKARIASEIVRSDLTTDIANAITDAITHFQKERFRFNEPALGSEPTFNTVIGRDTYGSGDLPDIANNFMIDYLTYVQAGIVFTITRDLKQDVKVYNQNGLMQGFPLSFTYSGNSITLAPVPNQVWTVSIMGHTLVAAPASDTEANNVWMNQGERLIRSMAKYILAKHRTRNQQMAQDMSPEPPALNSGVVGETWRIFKEMKGESNKLRARRRVTPMHF